MLLATVVDTFGQPLPHARFLAWSDKKTRRMMCRTDENGRCIRVVLPGDHGRLELPWRYSPWVEGGDQWQHDAECPTWSAGVAVRVVADMSKVLRIRFADWRGTPISSFKWSHHNDGMRTQDGKVIEGMGEHASGVAYLYSKSTLPKGSAVFVRVPGVGESYAVVDRDLHPEQGVHTLTLNRVAPQSLKIRLAESFPVKVGGTVTLQLQTAPNDPVRKSYFISFVRTALSKEFFLRDVLPGSYVLKTSAGAYSHPKQFVTLKPGGEGLILLE